MAEPFVGEMQIFAFPYAPKGWSIANGAILPVNQFQALFSLYGMTYGGDGRTTFGIPNVQTRFVCGTGQGPGLSARTPGQVIGSAQVQLTADQNGPHTHQLFDLRPTAVGERTPGPAGAVGFGYGDGLLAFATPAGTGTLDSLAVTLQGGAPHENRQPYIAMNYCVALVGIFPSIE